MASGSTCTQPVAQPQTSRGAVAVGRLRRQLDAAGLTSGLSVTAKDQADLSRITVVPGQPSSRPCIRGLRVTDWGRDPR
jgi:hypothetical protein